MRPKCPTPPNGRTRRPPGEPCPRCPKAMVSSSARASCTTPLFSMCCSSTAGAASSATPKLQSIKRSVEGRRLRRPLALESSMSIAGRCSSWEGNSNQTESRSVAKPQTQTGGPEPTKQYQLHAEDAEERRGHKTLNPRLCVTRRPLRENPREIARS